MMVLVEKKDKMQDVLGAAMRKIASLRLERCAAVQAAEKACREYEGKYHSDGALTKAGNPKLSQREYRVLDLEKKDNFVRQAHVLQLEIQALKTRVSELQNLPDATEMTVQEKASREVIEFQRGAIATKEAELADLQRWANTYTNPLGLSLDDAFARAKRIETTLLCARDKAKRVAKTAAEAVEEAEQRHRQASASFDEVCCQVESVQAAIDLWLQRIETNRQRAIARRSARLELARVEDEQEGQNDEMVAVVDKELDEKLVDGEKDDDEDEQLDEDMKVAGKATDEEEDEEDEADEEVQEAGQQEHAREDHADEDDSGAEVEAEHSAKRHRAC